MQSKDAVIIFGLIGVSYCKLAHRSAQEYQCAEAAISVWMGKSTLWEKRTTKRSFSAWCLLVEFESKHVQRGQTCSTVCCHSPCWVQGRMSAVVLVGFCLRGRVGAETWIPFRKEPALPCCSHGSHWWGKGAAEAKHQHSIASGLAMSEQNMRRGDFISVKWSSHLVLAEHQNVKLRDHHFCRAIEHHYKFLAGCKVEVFCTGDETCKLCQALM